MSQLICLHLCKALSIKVVESLLPLGSLFMRSARLQCRTLKMRGLHPLILLGIASKIFETSVFIYI